MSTNYPTSLDNSTTLPAEAAGVPLSTNHVIAHQNLQDSMEAVQAKVGIDGSAVTTSHDYKLSEVTSTDKAVSKTATQTLTNKTLTSPVITTPKITVGSDAVGDLHFTSNVDGTQSRLGKGNDNQILKMNGTSLNWEDETVTVNASTTVAGIVEEATQAEVDAGTAVGGTGARLFINPSTISVSSAKTNFLAGEAITAGQAVTSYYYQSDGGILYDSKTGTAGNITSAGGTQTLSLTVGSNSNRMLICFVSTSATTFGQIAATPSVTYNGVSMTLRDTRADANNQYKIFSFSLASPATGANNVVVTIPSSGSTQGVGTSVISYYNVSGIDTFTGSGVSGTATYIAPSNGLLLVSGMSISSTASSANNFNNFATYSGTNGQVATADSGIAFTNGANATVTYTNGSTTTQMTILGLTPFTALSYGYVVKSSAATPANGVNLNKYTTFAGIAQASVSAGASVSVVTDGNATNLSGLTPLATYFLSDTGGAISATAGTNSKKVGYANSATSLILKDTI